VHAVERETTRVSDRARAPRLHLNTGLSNIRLASLDSSLRHRSQPATRTLTSASIFALSTPRSSCVLYVFSSDDSASGSAQSQIRNLCETQREPLARERQRSCVHARIRLSARARRGMWTLFLVFAETPIAVHNDGNINRADCAIVDPPRESKVRSRRWKVRSLRFRVLRAFARERTLMNIRERDLEIFRFSLTRFRY